MLVFFLGTNAVKDVDSALVSNDPALLLQALHNPALQLVDVDPKNITHYARLLNNKKAEKIAESGDPDSILWIDEIQECVHRGNFQTKHALKREFHN